MHTSAGAGRVIPGSWPGSEAGEYAAAAIHRNGVGGGYQAHTISRPGAAIRIHASTTATLLAIAYRPDTRIGLENYTPLALYAIDPQSIMVPADSPFTTFKDLVEAARRNPDSLVAATTSVQGTGRMVLFLLEKLVPGTKFKFVTFKGGGDAVVAAAGANAFHHRESERGQGARRLEEAAVACGNVGPTTDIRAGRADAAGTACYTIAVGRAGIRLPRGVRRRLLLSGEPRGARAPSTGGKSTQRATCTRKIPGLQNYRSFS